MSSTSTTAAAITQMVFFQDPTLAELLASAGDLDFIHARIAKGNLPTVWRFFAGPETKDIKLARSNDPCPPIMRRQQQALVLSVPCEGVGLLLPVSSWDDMTSKKRALCRKFNVRPTKTVDHVPNQFLTMEHNKSVPMEELQQFLDADSTIQQVIVIKLGMKIPWARFVTELSELLTTGEVSLQR